MFVGNGLFGLFVPRSKSFELLSEDGNVGIRFAERSRGLYRIVILGKPSVAWVLKTVELIRGEKLRELYRTLKS